MPRGQFLYVSEDPDRSWRELGPHLLHETQSYGRWLAEAQNASNYQSVANLEELRTSGTYTIVTPAECIALATELGADAQLEFHPLVGGCAPEVGWSSLTLVEKEVLPALRAAGLLEGTDTR
jgi:hypothetical protein